VVEKHKENEQAWKVSASEILKNNCNIDIKNPNSKQEFEHLPPEQLADDILKKEQRIAEIMMEIKAILEVKP
jgi:type I restriction enzyme M protein